MLRGIFHPVNNSTGQYVRQGNNEQRILGESVTKLQVEKVMQGSLGATAGT